MGRVAEQALPMVRNVIEAVIYAVFPFVFLLFLLAQGRGLAMAIKSFVMSLVWIQLWPPLYAILNYVATLASARNPQPPPSMGTGAQGLALDTAASIYQRRHLRPGDRRLHGDLDPHHRHRHHQGRRSRLPGGDRRRRHPVGSVQRSASDQGLVTQNAVSMDQQQLAPTRTSAFMSSTTDARGTTIQGTGMDAGVFRYQAT
jgi:conjugal transfer mating pair stabilization protein TraG